MMVFWFCMSRNVTFCNRFSSLRHRYFCFSRLAVAVLEWWDWCSGGALCWTVEVGRVCSSVFVWPCSKRWYCTAYYSYSL